VALTLIENANGPATKAFTLGEDGKLRKQAAAQIYLGNARVLEACGIKGLIEIIEQLASNQALTYGVPVVREAKLLTQAELRRAGGIDAIARDREHFRFTEVRPGVLMLDHDPRPGHPDLDWSDIDTILCECVPGWNAVERAWRPSASAYIYRSNGEELIGRGGLRCYVIVDHAAAIPSIGAFIYQALWAAGHGYIVVSKSGRALDRTLVDANVWQPERLDFVAAPVLGPGLERHSPTVAIVPGEPMLASAGLRSETTMAEWRVESLSLKKALEAARTVISRTRRDYIAAQVAELQKRTPDAQIARLRRVVTRAVDYLCLGPEFSLLSSDGAAITVGEILSDPDKWDCARFADPLEPDYRGDARIAYACLRADDNEPFIYSHAHGGIRYALVRESAQIRVVVGEQPRVVDEALDLLRARGEIFERGGEPVRLASGGIVPAGDEWLLDYLGRHVNFTALRRRRNEIVEERVDAPRWLAPRISAKHGERGLRDLRAVISAPTMRPDGSLLVTSGYDEATGLLVSPGQWPHIPDEPSHDALVAAAATLWRPFADFPFVDETSRSVMVAALLTAKVRQSLPLAPGTSFDAPDAGTGKTLLGKCLLVVSGTAPTVVPECRDEGEMRKRLLSILRAGQPGVLFDNIRGQFGSSTIEALLTAEHYSDRVMGFSQMISLPTRVLVLFSGNNFRPSGDLWRRILTSRIDAKIDQPELRSFPLDAFAHCRQHRQEIVAAGLTLLRGFVAAGLPRTTTDKLGSFEAWDDLVRQAVIWIGSQNLMPKGASVGDPVKAIAVAKADEPERQKLLAFLSVVHEIMEDQRWSVANLMTRSEATAASEHDPTDGPVSALWATLDDIAGERGKINRRRLGRWVEKHADRRVSGLGLERCPGRAGAAYWRVRSGPKAPA